MQNLLTHEGVVDIKEGIKDLAIKPGHEFILTGDGNMIHKSS